MTTISIWNKPVKHESETIWAHHMADFVDGVQRGIVARSQGKVQSLDEVIAELGIR